MKFTPDDFFKKEDGNDFLSYLISDLTNTIYSYDYNLLKTDLWKLTKAVTHELPNNPLNDLGLESLFDTIDKLIEGAWQFIEIRKRYNFKHSELNKVYVSNPFRQLRKHRTFQEGGKYSYQSPFLGVVNNLSKEEVRNFTLVIDDFFSRRGVIEWKREMKNWKLYAQSEETIISSGLDMNPLLTYEYLLKLVEAGFLAQDFEEYEWDRPPNYNLLLEENLIIEFDPYKENNFNPFEQLNMIFNVYNGSILKEQFAEWYDCAVQQEKIWDNADLRRLFFLHKHLVMLVEVGCLITKFDEIPEEWLDPNKFKKYATPVQEANGKYIQYLTKEECAGLTNTLSASYKKIGIDSNRYNFKELLHGALSTKEKPFEDLYHFFEKTNRIIEVLYLINLNISNKHNSI